MPATILLVVPDPQKRNDWKEFLIQQGYRTIVITSGERAPDLCLHLQPDLVLLEDALPDASGFEVCRRLKDDPRNRHTPVVLITALSSDGSASRAREAGADDLWEARPSRWEALGRIQSLLHLRSYIDEQAAAVVLSLARSIEARDPYTRGHCERLSSLAEGFGKRIGLAEEQLEALRVAGTVHDIGKIIVPDAILAKPGPLTVEEMHCIKQHPVEGERICSPLKSFRFVLPIIRHHHERTDGSGYPDGLSGDNIPLTARILQVVDVYDALTTDRPYRGALSRHKALQTLCDEVDKRWLDAELVGIFAKFALDPDGLRVLDLPRQAEELPLAK